MRTQSLAGAPPVYPMDTNAQRQTLNREHASRALNQMYGQYGMSPTQLALNPPQGVNQQELERLNIMQNNPQQYDDKYGTGLLSGMPQQSQGIMSVGMPGTGGGVSIGSSQMNPLQALFGAAAKSPTSFGTSQAGRLPGLLNNNPF